MQNAFDFLGIGIMNMKYNLLTRQVFKYTVTLDNMV